VSGTAIYQTPIPYILNTILEWKLDFLLAESSFPRVFNVMSRTTEHGFDNSWNCVGGVSKMGKTRQVGCERTSVATAFGSPYTFVGFVSDTGNFIAVATFSGVRASCRVR